MLLGDIMKDVVDLLEQFHIPYQAVHHPAAWTTDEADTYIEGMEGCRTKTIFLAGKKDRHFYLVILDDHKRLDIKKLNELLEDKLHFASEETLQRKLQIVPGMVSIFNLIHNQDHDVQVVIDRDLLEEKIVTFHPNDNTVTIFIALSDMFRFLELIHYDYQLFLL